MPRKQEHEASASRTWVIVAIIVVAPVARSVTGAEPNLVARVDDGTPKEAGPRWFAGARLALPSNALMR